MNPLHSSKDKQIPPILIEYLRNELNQPSLDYQEPLTPLGKGWGGSLFSFKLKNPPPQLTNQLLLRFSPNVPKEGTIQKALQTQNYPVPPIHHLCTDTSIIGKPFLIRDYLKGDVLWTEPTNKKRAKHMAENHIKLHQINPDPIVKALEKADVNKYAYEGSMPIDKLILEKQVFGANFGSDWKLEKDLTWLEPGAEWMQENKPSNSKKVVNHGDFHPNNIVVDDGKVQAVIDWQMCRVNAFEYDIATSLHILLDLGPALRAEKLCFDLVRDYLEIYRNQVDVDEELLDYYMGVKTLSGFCGMEIGFQVWSLPGVYERLVKRFWEISGIKLERPASNK